MKRIFTMTAMLCVVTLTTWAQTMLKGKVTDGATQKPLAGASVSFGKNSGTVTDKDGAFTIECGKASKITVTYIGYEPFQQIVRNCSDELNIVLIPTGHSLEEVEITSISNPNKSILYQPQSIAKLTPTELKRGNGLFLEDAIQANAPGVSMNRRTVSGGQQLNIRGYGNGSRGTRGISSNFDGQGYKVYLNGIPVTDAEGITTFDDLDFASIDNVEITKGPAGTLYGLAIAGAANLRTIKPEKGKTSIGQEVMLGSYGLQRYTTQFQMGKERSAILLNYGHQQTDGYTNHNKSKKDFANFVGDFEANEKQSINTYVGYTNSYDERFGELTLTQWDNNDYSGNPEYIKRNAHSNVITFRAGLGHTYNFSKNVSNVTSIFGTGFNGNASSAGGWTDKSAVNYGLRSVLNTRFAVGESTTLNGVTGIESQRQDAMTVGYNMKQNPHDTNPTWIYGVSPYWVINAITSDVATISKTTSLFTQWTLALAHDLSLTAGVGVSNMKIELNDRFNSELATRPAQYKHDYKNMVSPHFAINKVFNKHFSVYASYSKGYKAPVSSYFYITTPAVTTPATPATGRVNEDLKPEIGTQYEAGTKGQLLDNRLTYELTYFNLVFSNKMTAVAVQSPANPSTTLYSYVVNGGKQNHSGVEALVRFAVVRSVNGFFRSVQPFANLAYADFTYGDNFTIQKSVVLNENYSNKIVAGVPKYSANVGVDVLMKYGIYANVVYNYKDKIAITSLNDYWASSFNLLNTKIGIQRSLGTHFDVNAYLGASNLTNTRYYMMVFVNQLPDAYIPAPRNANFFGGVNLKYNF